MKSKDYTYILITICAALLLGAAFLSTSASTLIAAAWNVPAAQVTVPASPNADSGASTAFVIPYPLTQGPECAIPYFTIAPGMVKTSIHVMNTNPVSETDILLAYWSTEGLPLPSALVTYTIPPLQSLLIGPETISDTLSGKDILEGSGWIYADHTIACLVKSTPSPDSPHYLSAFTPPIAYDRLVFPAVGSPRDDLTPLVYIQNGEIYAIDVDIEVYVDGEHRDTIPQTISTKGVFVFDPIAHGSIVPGEVASIQVVGSDVYLSGFLALVDPSGAHVEAFEGVSTTGGNNWLVVPKALHHIDDTISDLWLGQTDPASAGTDSTVRYHRIGDGQIISQVTGLDFPYMTQQHLQMPNAVWAGSVEVNSTDLNYPALSGIVLERTVDDLIGSDVSGYSVIGPYDWQSASPVYLPAVHRHPEHATYYWAYNPTSSDIIVHFKIYDHTGNIAAKRTRIIEPRTSVYWDQAEMDDLGSGIRRQRHD